MKPLNFFEYWNSRFKSKSSIVLFYVMLSIMLTITMSGIIVSLYWLILAISLKASLLFPISTIISALLAGYFSWPIFFKDYWLYRKNFKN